MARRKTTVDSVSGTCSEALKLRLGQLVAEHGLSGLAQRTATPVSSIHRYVHGGRVPATFCAALAQHYQVNPAWLLLGKGQRYATEVGGDAAAMAAGMREVVHAMQAASQLKLGTLAGRRDISLLRELADASSRVEKLRGRLTREVEPVIRDWLAALRDALNRFDHTRAGDLEAALARLLSFTDDASLIRDFDRLRAQSAYIQGRRGEAVDLQRRNLMLLLAEGGELRDAELRECFNLCVALSGLGRSEEGKAVAEATLALRRSGSPTGTRVQLVQSMLAAFELSLGNVPRAVSLMQGIYTQRTPESAPNLELVQAMIMLRVHGFRAQTVLREVGIALPLTIEVLRNALWREDGGEIRGVVEFVRNADERLLEGAHIYAAQADWVQRILTARSRRGPPPGFDALEARIEAGGVLERLDAAVLRCQRARLLRSKDAGELALAAHEQLRALPAGVCADVTSIGLHARNVRALATGRGALESASRSMQDEIASLHGAGFGMFRSFGAAALVT